MIWMKGGTWHVRMREYKQFHAYMKHVRPENLKYYINFK